ncbi:MAG TPA: aldose epimerase family protein [Candidatus Eremiobacteraceae bacterium]|nr:aldose epimerase family protein [Candidatus Eremiobacteraceae bacterium]
MKHFRMVVAVLILIVATTGALMANTQVSQRSGGKLPDGSAVQIYTLKSDRVEVQVMNYGGYVMSIRVPDRTGRMADVVLGFDQPDQYYQANHAKGNPFFGPIIGRYANRIAHAKFSLNGKEYTLPKNDGDNTLHGGPDGFHNHLWTGHIIPDGVELKYLSKDGEEGFPGSMSVTVKYTLTGSDLKIDYAATTDKPTVLNLTNHSYFNLSGQGNGTILNHQLKLNASRFTPVDASLIPTGELKSVSGTPFDFLKPHTVGERINANDEQLHLAHNGYDHNFVIDAGGGKELKEAAEVYDPSTGRVLTVLTTQPGVQFYSANFLDGSIKGKGGNAYPRNAALCLETQHFPDSPNQPKFPTTVLNPGSQFHSVTVFRFTTR